tara:strand:- start:583 stop:1041 length:459 start_codon:yes stop_codon:yes gene_type:complete
VKKILFILFCLPFLGFGQQKTFIHDDNFEQALINLGYDNVLDDSVLTANIYPVTVLNVSAQNISDFTGIEDFMNMDAFNFGGNLITFIDLSNNIKLDSIIGVQNMSLDTIDLSNNTLLRYVNLWAFVSLQSINLDNHDIYLRNSFFIITFTL